MPNKYGWARIHRTLPYAVCYAIERGGMQVVCESPMYYHQSGQWLPIKAGARKAKMGILGVSADFEPATSLQWAPGKEQVGKQLLAEFHQSGKVPEKPGEGQVGIPDDVPVGLPDEVYSADPMTTPATVPEVISVTQAPTTESISVRNPVSVTELAKLLVQVAKQLPPKKYKSVQEAVERLEEALDL